MARVDPDDDTISRYVIEHFRYDNERHQRRNVVVEAFDGEEEMTDRVSVLTKELRAAKQRGVAEAVETIGGVWWPAGSRQRAREQRSFARAWLSSGSPNPPEPPVATESRIGLLRITWSGDAEAPE